MRAKLRVGNFGFVNIEGPYGYARVSPNNLTAMIILDGVTDPIDAMESLLVEIRRWLHPSESDSNWLWQERKRMYSVTLENTAWLMDRGTECPHCGVCGSLVTPTEPNTLAVPDPKRYQEDWVYSKPYPVCDPCCEIISPEAIGERNRSNSLSIAIQLAD